MRIIKRLLGTNFARACAGIALIMLAAALTATVPKGRAATAKRAPLTFENRVAAQRAIEEVYHRHRIWPKDNPQPKPVLEAVLPESALRAKVDDYLRRSNALEHYWQRPITGEQLQAEMERMARQTKQPEVLRELWAALGNDPVLIAECLARPLLAERLVRQRDASDDRFHQANAGVPSARDSHTAVWTGSEMIIWGGNGGGSYLNTGGRYNPATDSWTTTATTGAPSVRSVHTAVWTGSEMIVWGGGVGSSYLNTGGRYNPATDSWTATTTTGAPSARYYHTAVWTGGEMIVWSGGVFNGPVNTGGRYNPVTNTWMATTTTGAPNARLEHTAVWTGGEMAIWGGNSGSSYFNTGGRYNPATDSWTATTTTGVPGRRSGHTAVWTGSEMIVWGGSNGSATLNTGGRYKPATDSWTATTTTGASSARYIHTGVWSGSEMIIWGGVTVAGGGITLFNTGGRYNPATDSWTTATTTSAPSARFFSTAIWSGSEMIVWGGSANSYFNTGGRYNPATNTWTATNACIYSIAPVSQAFEANGGTGSVNVTAISGCSWMASSQATWVTFTSGSSGTGNGAVNYSVAPSPSPSPRTGTITIAGQTFTVTQAAAVACPTVSSINPTNGAVGSTITVTGANFTGVMMVKFVSNLPATFTVNSDRQITAIVPNGSVSGPITISKQGCTDLQTGVFTITNPSPTLISLNPPSAIAGSSGFTLTVIGKDFVNGAVVRWNGNDRATTYVSGTQLTAAIPTSDIASAGAANITVFNPAPGGGASNTISLTIRQMNKPSQITSVTPNPVIAGGQGFTLTVNGGDFVSGSTLRWDGNDRPTTFVSTTRLTAAIPAADIATAHEVRITVFTPDGGGVSNQLILTIANAVTSVPAGSFSGTTIAPDSIVAAFGTKLATAVKIATTTPLPTELEGTTVKITDSAGAERLARLFFVAPMQINYLMPAETAAGAATITVRSGDGTVSVGTAMISPAAPSLFTANANGQGVAAGVALRVKADGAQVYEPIARFDSTLNRFVPEPIDLGNADEQVFLVLYGSGIRRRSALSAVTATIGGLNHPVLFAGAVEGLFGLDQVNVGPLSRSLIGRGEVEVALTVDGRPANLARVSFK